MSKETKQQSVVPDGPIEVAGVKRNNQFCLVLRTRVSGKVEEQILKVHADRRIIADRMTAAMLEVFR